MKKNWSKMRIEKEEEKQKITTTKKASSGTMNNLFVECRKSGC